MIYRFDDINTKGNMERFVLSIFPEYRDLDVFEIQHSYVTQILVALMWYRVHYSLTEYISVDVEIGLTKDRRLYHKYRYGGKLFDVTKIHDYAGYLYNRGYSTIKRAKEEGIMVKFTYSDYDGYNNIYAEFDLSKDEASDAMMFKYDGEQVVKATLILYDQDLLDGALDWYWGAIGKLGIFVSERDLYISTPGSVYNEIIHNVFQHAYVEDKRMPFELEVLDDKVILTIDMPRRYRIWGYNEFYDESYKNENENMRRIKTVFDRRQEVLTEPDIC